MGYAEPVIHIDFKKKVKKKSPVKKIGEGFVRSPEIVAVSVLRDSFKNASGEKELRDRLVLEILCRTGMRASELVILKRSDFLIIQGEPVLRFYRPKKNDHHQIKLNKSSRDFLLSLIDAYHREAGIDSDQVLWSLPNLMTKKRTKLCRRSLQRIVNGFGLTDARGKTIAPHGLRHYVGIRASRERDHSLGSKLLGNSLKVFSEYYSEPFTEALD